MPDTPLEELRRESADWHHCWDGDDSAPVDEGFAIDAALITALEAENERLRRERERAENAMRRYNKLAPRRVPGL